MYVQYMYFMASSEIVGTCTCTVRAGISSNIIRIDPCLCGHPLQAVQGLVTPSVRGLVVLLLAVWRD